MGNKTTLVCSNCGLKKDFAYGTILESQCRVCDGVLNYDVPMHEIRNSKMSEKKRGHSNPDSAVKLLQNAATHIGDRAASRDTDNERSMARCVTAFNAIYNKDLTETEGWQFMTILKKVRGAQGAFRLDDYEDDIAYAALAAESAIKGE